MATTMTAELIDPIQVIDVTPAPARAIRKRRKRATTITTGDRMGPWRVERELGRGGMGAVYAVVHNGFGKRAALKLCHPNVLGPTFTMETFLREARIVHLVDHPGVVDVFATGSFENRPYLAMERLVGKTLGQRLDEGSLPRHEAIDILLELCDVLGAAHAKGVVHRDLKLDNVFLLDEPGAGGRRVKLLDWGVAKIGGEVDPMHGMIAGTLSYVAPEQVRGEPIGAPADIYSLGVMAYLLLLGSAPFSGSTDLELIKQHLHACPPPPEARWLEIPAPLARVMIAMLAKSPTERPTLATIVDALAEARRHLVPRRRLLSRITLIPVAPPIDVLGRPAPLLAIKHRAIGALFGVAALAASAATWLSV